MESVMGEETKIEWTDHTFNPWWGCARVSPGCENCYAETFATGRMKLPIWGPKAERRFFSDRHWAEPLKWARSAQREGVRRRVFCASMADVFEDRADLAEPRERLFRLIEATPALDWLLLTKRPENIQRLCRWSVRRGGVWPSNVWLGTTAEDQKRLVARLEFLIQEAAAVRFLSVEPMLGPLDLENVTPYYIEAIKTGSPFEPTVAVDALRGHVKGPDDVLPHQVNWVIVGGESGSDARPFHVEWARSVVRQCRSAGVPVFVKQLGSHPRTSGMTNPGEHWPVSTKLVDDRKGGFRAALVDRKGGDMAGWPEDLRVREWPR
jgi:protein gp37